VARVGIRLASGREIALALRAGIDTAEWAYDRPDVRPLMAHQRAPVLESWPAPGGFPGHRYHGILPLGGRFLVDGVRVERLPGAGRLTLSRLALLDTTTGLFTPVALPASYVSDARFLREAAGTPLVRLYQVQRAPGRAWVAGSLRVLGSGEAVLQALRAPTASGLDLTREALAAAGDVAGIALPPGSLASRAFLVRALGNRIEVHAAGPGLLVVAEGFDPGWSGRVDDEPARVLRVNHTVMGIVLPAGTHHVRLSYRARGFLPGLLLAGLGVALLALAVRR
jgi:hypothetical protein